MPKLARVKWAKFRVAVVVVSGFVILLALLFELFGGVLLAPKTVIYLYIPDASGLSGDSPVRVDGINVGRVANVELSGAKDPNRAVKVTLLFYRDRLVGVPIDSVAQISSDSLIGDKFVDINGGTSSRYLHAEGELIYKDQPELLRSLDLTQFTKQLLLVDETLTDLEEGRSQFGKFFHGTEFYNDLLRRMVDLQKGIRAAVSTTSAVGSLLNSDKLNRQVSDALTQVDQEIAQVQAGQGTAGQLLRSSAQYDQLLNSTQQFRRTLETISKSDLMQSDDAYVGVNRTLGTLIQDVDEFNRNPLITSTSVYENLNGSLKELQDSLRDFRLNPKKYLRLKLF